MVVPQFPQVAPQVHPDMESLHQSMMTFCQTATTALAEQQRLAAEMRETLAKILELSAGPETVPEAGPEAVPEVPERGEVGGRLSPTPSPRGASRQEKTPAPVPGGHVGCPEDCICMGGKSICCARTLGYGLRLDLVGEEGWEEVVADNHSARMTYREPLTPLTQEDEDDDEGGYSTDGYTPRSDDGDMEQKMRSDKYTARWGVTHGGHKINYDEPVYTPDGNGMMMPRGVFQDSGWGGWGSDIAVGDIVRTFPHGGICEKTKQYGIVTKLKKGGEEKRVDAFVVDIIMFIPEMERELNSTLKSPITGMCGYKIGLQKTFSTQSRMAKLV